MALDTVIGRTQDRTSVTVSVGFDTVFAAEVARSSVGSGEPNLLRSEVNEESAGTHLIA